MQSLLALTVLLSLGLCWARPSESGPEVVSAEYIREMAARNAQGTERRQLGDMEEVDEPVTALCPVDGNDRNPCLNGGECIPVQESTPTGHNYVCRCQGDYGGFVCGVANPCNSCEVYCVRTSLDSRGRYCYNEKFELVDEFPASTGNPQKMLTELVKGKMKSSSENSVGQS